MNDLILSGEEIEVYTCGVWLPATLISRQYGKIGDRQKDKCFVRLERDKFIQFETTKKSIRRRK